MPINPNIAMSFQQPQVESPLNAFAKYAAIQNAQNQNALAQYQLSAAQRSDQENNALNQAYREAYDPSTGSLDFNKVMGRAAQYGAGSKIPALVKTQHEADKAKWESVAAQDKAIADRTDLSRRQLEGIDPNSPDAPAQLMQWHLGNHKDPILGPYFAQRGITPEQSVARIRSAVEQGPQAIARLVDESKMGAAKVADLHKAVSVAAGAQLRDPVTGALIAEGGPQLAELTKEYQAARLPENGGFKGTMADYVTMKASAGANRIAMNVASYMPASEAAQKDFMDKTAKNYDALRNVPQTLANIDATKALIPAAKGFMGPGGEPLLEATKFLNNRLGTNINVEGVKSAEELRSRLFFGIMDNLKKMDAQPSEQQQIMMRDALGKLGTDPAALPAVLDAYGDSLRNKVALHNAEVKSAISRGVKFPVEPVIDLSMPDQKPEAKSEAKVPAVGTVQKGYRFKGGDPANQANWEKVK